MSLNPNIVFIAFSDTHGNADKLAQLYTLIKQTIDCDHKANPEIQHILLVPGDVFGVSAIWSVLSDGQFDIDAISKIAELFPEKHRFFTPGNHDFYYGEEKLIALVNKAKFQVVISNTQFKANSELPFESLAKLTVSGEELTLGGLMTPETLNATRAREVIENEKSINPCPKLETLPDICLSHLGSRSDQALLQNEKFLNAKSTIIVGGHTHDAQVPKNVPDGNSLMVNTGAGECIVILRGGGKKPELLFAQDCSPSSEILELIDKCATQYKIDLNNLKSPVFTIAENSETPSGLELKPNTTSHLRIEDSLMMRFTADAIAESLRKKNEKVDFVLYPAASIRSNFLRGQAVTGMHLFETYYYSDKLVKMDLTGSELVHLFAFGVMQGYKCCANRGQLLTPSEGLTYAYDVNPENPGHTILEVKIKDKDTREYKFIDPEAIFCIVTTNWIGDEVKKLYPTIAMKEYSDVPKIFEMVIEKGRQYRGNVYEKFGKRILSKQTPEYQAGLMQQPGNRRADIPTFDRYRVEINFDTHRRNFERQKESPESSLSATPGRITSFFGCNLVQTPAENAGNSAATSNSAIVYKK